MSNHGKGNGEGAVERNTIQPGDRSGGASASQGKIDAVKDGVKDAVHKIVGKK